MKDKVLKGLQVELREKESCEQLIKRFTRLIKDNGILKEYREKMRYVKPSEAKRRKSSRARARLLNDKNT